MEVDSCPIIRTGQFQVQSTTVLTSPAEAEVVQWRAMSCLVLYKLTDFERDLAIAASKLCVDLSSPEHLSGESYA